MELKKRQHYVPKFYLKRFADSKDQVFVFDKFENKDFRTHINNIAQETYFYDFPGELLSLEERQLVENAFAEFDNWCAKIIQNFFEEITVRRKGKKPTQRKILHKKEKIQLAEFMVLQLFRTKEFRETWIEMSEKAFQVILEKFIIPSNPITAPDKYKVEYNRDFASVDQAAFVFNEETLRTFVGILVSHIWLIGLNETKKTLWTSDHPFTRRAHLKRDFISHTGIASPGIEIAFPLSPRVILILFERTYFKRINNLDGRIVQLNEDNVDYYNSLQMYSSYRQIYSSDDNFELAKEICRKHPELCSENKQRIAVN